jgi:hypothetical protein
MQSWMGKSCSLLRLTPISTRILPIQIKGKCLRKGYQAIGSDVQADTGHSFEYIDILGNLIIVALRTTPHTSKIEPRKMV